MPYTTVVAGTSITASWANANVRDQVVTPFVSSASRTASISSPVAGMTTVLTTNTVTEGIEVYNSAGAWRKPWNMPWGVITKDTISSDGNIGTSFASTNIVSSGSGRVLNRSYRIDAWGTVFISGGIAQTIELRLVPSTGAAVTLQAFTASGTTLYNVYVTAWHDAPTTIASGWTWTLEAKSSGGAGSPKFYNSLYPGRIMVSDQGPSGAPA